jgi:hypothetical protein
VLLKTKEMAALQKPSKRDYNSVTAWLINNPPLVQGEMKFIRCKEDIVSLRSGRESGGFEGLIERILSGSDRCLRAMKCEVIRVSPTSLLATAPS